MVISRTINRLPREVQPSTQPEPGVLLIMLTADEREEPCRNDTRSVSSRRTCWSARAKSWRTVRGPSFLRPPPCLSPLAHGEIMPSTSLSRLDATFPVIIVKSMVAVATVNIPPPAPMLSGCGRPLAPGVIVPFAPFGLPPSPAVAGPPIPGTPPVPSRASFNVMRSVAFD